MLIRRLTASVWSFLAATMIALPALAQQSGSTPGPPGPQGPPGPSGSTTTTTVFGMDQTTALVIGGLVLFVVVVLAIVSMSKNSRTA